MLIGAKRADLNAISIFVNLLMLCAFWFWRRSVPGKRGAVHFKSVVEFEVLRLFIGQGLSLGHLKTDESVVSVHTCAQSGGCWSSISVIVQSAHAKGRGVAHERTSEAYGEQSQRGEDGRGVERTVDSADDEGEDAGQDW